MWWEFGNYPALPGCHGILLIAAILLPLMPQEHHSLPKCVALLAGYQGYCAWGKKKINLSQSMPWTATAMERIFISLFKSTSLDQKKID